MKNSYTIFALLLMLMIFASCGKDSVIAPSDEPVAETKDLKEFMTGVETALKNKDATTFLSYFSDNYTKYYAKVVTDNKAKLTEFAKLLETRQLITTDGTYAVYVLTYNGKNYEISLTLDDSGNWKIKDM